MYACCTNEYIASFDKAQRMVNQPSFIEIWILSLNICNLNELEKHE